MGSHRLILGQTPRDLAGLLPKNWSRWYESLRSPRGEKGDDRVQGKRHTPEQIIVLLRKAEVELGSGCTIGQVCQKLAISEQTAAWPQQYGGMKADEMKRLRELEMRTRLKKIVADQALDIQMLKEVARETAQARRTPQRRAVEHLCKAFNVSERRACSVLDQPRSTQRLVPAERPADKPLVPTDARAGRSTSPFRLSPHLGVAAPARKLASTASGCTACGVKLVSKSPGGRRRNAGWDRRRTAVQHDVP